MRRYAAICILLLASGISGSARADSDDAADRRADAQRACDSHAPTCDWVATFASLEQQTIARALAKRGVLIDPQPWGKRIAHIRVFNEEVFAEDNWLQFFNIFHWTTREGAIAKELTVDEGEVWDDVKIAESARKLHDPLFSTVVALLPAATGVPGTVDLFVVTRDIWSLRLNTQYTYQESSLTNLAISISENNFLGQRNVLSAAVLMDQSTVAVGPLFIDKNFLGEHLSLTARFDEILTRRAPLVYVPAEGAFVSLPGDSHGIEDQGIFHSEGHDASVALAYPLWSLRSEWGGGLAVTERDAIVRAFTGAAPAMGVTGNPNSLYSDPGTGLPYEYLLNTWSVNPYVVRQWGDDFKFQLTGGYVLSSQRPSLLANFPGDASEAAQFEADVFPHSEVISQPYLDFAGFTPRYETLRNVDSYELAEDLRTGPSYDVSLGVGLALIGGTNTFARPAASIGWTFPIGRDGFIAPTAGVSLRVQGGPHDWDTIDNTASVGFRAASPASYWLRVVGAASVQTRWHDTQNAFSSIGSDSGLRGYAVGQLEVIGSARRIQANVELRSAPLPVWVLRAGGVLFYDGGSVAQTFGEMQYLHDVGVGARVLIPQTSRDVLRLDIAFPLVATLGNPLFSPHFIAGFASYF